MKVYESIRDYTKVVQSSHSRSWRPFQKHSSTWMWALKHLPPSDWLRHPQMVMPCHGLLERLVQGHPLNAPWPSSWQNKERCKSDENWMPNEATSNQGNWIKCSQVLFGWEHFKTLNLLFRVSWFIQGTFCASPSMSYSFADEPNEASKGHHDKVYECASALHRQVEQQYVKTIQTQVLNGNIKQSEGQASSMSFFAQEAWEITWGYMRPFLTAQLEKECSIYSSCIKSWIYAHHRETHWLSAAPARDNTCPLDKTFVKRGCRFLKYLYAVMVIVVSSSCIFCLESFDESSETLSWKTDLQQSKDDRSGEGPQAFNASMGGQWFTLQV